MRFRTSFSQLSDEEIGAIEGALGFRFPDPIRHHYRKFNGGQPEDLTILVEGSPVLIHCFLTLQTEDRNMSFEQTYHRLVEGNQLWPEHLIPFAYDRGGNHFCFSRRAEDFGFIYYHQSEYAGEQEEILLLSKSFSDLFF